MIDIADNLKTVNEKIAAAAERCGRKADDITLVTVTKTHPPEMMNEAIKHGAKDIGENKPQEIRDKYDSVLPVRWHMIGHLQTNKVKYVVGKCCLIHSVDSIKVMDEIERIAAKQDIVQEILIEVNISGEETKSGIAPSELAAMLIHAGELKHVKIMGLMTIAPKSDNPVSSNLHFNKMHELYVDISTKKYDNVIMRYLSMGMSGDYEVAIECGANMVRVGSAIFGPRDYSKI